LRRAAIHAITPVALRHTETFDMGIPMNLAACARRLAETGQMNLSDALRLPRDIEDPGS
jgi:hypothetical protein